MSAANAVDISVLLGLVDWDLWIRTGLLGGAACSALCSFIICVNIIREVAREKKQEKRQIGVEMENIPLDNTKRDLTGRLK